jgi:hypothetical protein
MTAHREAQVATNPTRKLYNLCLFRKKFPVAVFALFRPAFSSAKEMLDQKLQQFGQARSRLSVDRTGFIAGYRTPETAGTSLVATSK